MSTSFTEKLSIAFEQNKLSNLLNEAKAKKFEQLSALLVEANKTTNLTAITDEEEIILKHFVDCATVVDRIPENAKVLDVGCGGGFPSLPIAILREDISVLSLDSTGKKIDFVNRAIGELELISSSAICARAEEFASQARESFDCCVSRAVARLNILSELCLPMVKIGGIFIAMKSEKASDEFAESKHGIKILGGADAQFEHYTLEHNGKRICREIIAISKSRKTPAQYPRKYSQILKKPL